MADINIPALVKSLRKALGLTQEQFAHKVGVTFSTVNQWENGRRRPQPFLLRQLLSIKDSLRANSAGALTREEAQAYKRRWDMVNAAERKELASLSMAHKFRQVAALLASAKTLGWNEDRIAEENLVRERWSQLRKEHHD
jgi:putative transcriptional regulator